MKTRTSRLCTFTLISLLSLFGVAAQAGAQADAFNQLSSPPKLRGRAGRTHKAMVSDASGYSVLYSFCSVGLCTDGETPRAGLIQDAAGNLYGTTYFGGAYGYGTVFKVDSTGHETVLYSFCPGGGSCTDGASPSSGLIQDPAGNLYGTTYQGGNSANPSYCDFGCGTVFKVDNTGQETVLYAFCPDGGSSKCTDGQESGR